MSDTSLVFNILARDRATEKILGIKSAFGLLAVGVAAGAAMFAAKSIQMAADFESSTTRLITSAGETQQNIGMVRKGMLDMAGEVGNSAQSLSAAMYTVESGGRHGAEGLLVLRAAAEGAKAEGADLTTVADALTSVLQDYHLKGSDAALVTSQMVAAVGAGKTTFEQFAGSLHSVLPLASQAHIAFTDVSAAIASMTVHGMSADQATQNLNDTIRHMMAPLDTQKTEFKLLGVQSTWLADTLGKRGLNGTLQDLSQLILSHMGPSGKILLNTFNQSKDAARDANIMVSKMPPNLQSMAKQFQTGAISLGDWRKSLKGLPPEQANLLQQFAAMQNNASGFNNALKSGGPAAQNYTEALKKATGDATGLNTALMLTGENTDYVNNAMHTIAGATTEAGNHVKGWKDIQETFNQKMSETKAAMGALTIKIGNDLLPAAKDMLGVIMNVVTWLEKHSTTAKTLGVVIGTLAASMLLYKGYTLAANIVTKAATVAEGLHTAAKYAGNAATWVYVAAQGAATSTLGTWIGVQALDFAAWIRKAATVAANTASLVAYAVATNAVRVATIAWTAVQWLLNVAFLASPIGWIVLGIMLIVAVIVLIATKTTWFQTAWKWTWGGIKAAALAVGHWFAGPFAGFFVKLWNDIVGGVKGAGHWVQTTFDRVIGFVTGLPGRISRAASGMWNGIKDSFRGAINWIIGKWNGLSFTLGGGSFMGMNIPSMTLSAPSIPYLAQGGIVPATPGGRLVVVGEGGHDEAIVPLTRGGSGLGGGVVRLVLDFTGADRELVELFRNAIRVRGGNVQAVIGS